MLLFLLWIFLTGAINTADNTGSVYVAFAPDSGSARAPDAGPARLLPHACVAITH